MLWVLDVHAKTVVACVIKKGRKEIRTFATMTEDLLQLGDWLTSEGCTHVAIESTGVYWKPVFNLLEGTVEVILVNAQHIKAVPGRKTDVRDCEWLADLLRQGLLRSSFIPPREIRELRELTRYRQTLLREHAAVANRLQKLLESGNIKLGQVASDVLGLSGRLMLQALAEGEQDGRKLAELAQGKLKNKKDALRHALVGRLTQVQRWVLGATRAKGTFLAAKYYRLVKRMGKKKALVAVAHGRLRVVYQLLHRRVGYTDLGSEYVTHHQVEQQRQRLVQKLQALGVEVTLEEVGQAA